MEKVKTRQHVAEIWASRNKVASLSARWLAAIRCRDMLQARSIRREINAIKQNILAKYDVII